MFNIYCLNFTPNKNIIMYQFNLSDSLRKSFFTFCLKQEKNGIAPGKFFATSGSNILIFLELLNINIEYNHPFCHFK